MTNPFSSRPTSPPNELTETLVQATSIRIERIISHGHASRKGIWHIQTENESVLLVQCAAQLWFEDELVELKSGNRIDIPAYRMHEITRQDHDLGSSIFTKDYQ